MSTPESAASGKPGTALIRRRASACSWRRERAPFAARSSAGLGCFPAGVDPSHPVTGWRKGRSRKCDSSPAPPS